MATRRSTSPAPSAAKKSSPPKKAPAPKREQPKEPMVRLFSGSKSKWLPLFGRLAARLHSVRGVALLPHGAAIQLTQTSSQGRAANPIFARLRVTAKGLEIDFAFHKSVVRSSRLKPAPKSAPKPLTHRTLLCRQDEIDDEFMNWLKSAMASTRATRG